MDKAIESLIQRSFTGDLTPAERAELNEWLSQSDENSDMYVVMESLRMWQNPEFTPDAMGSNEEGFRAVERRIRRHERANGWLVGALRTAACIAVVPLLLVSIFSLRGVVLAERLASAMQQVRVPFGLQSEIELPDGSHVWLNGGSELRFPNRFDKDERRVELIGEGYFEVDADTRHPFRVVTEHADIVATGTEFNVNAYAHDSIVAVTMLRGKVALYYGAKSQMVNLRDNEHAMFNIANGTLTTTIDSPYKHLCWKDGVLAFRNDRLDYVFKRLEHIYNVDIVLMDSEIGSHTYHATFNNESLDEILYLLTLTAPLKYEYRSSPNQRQHGGSKIYISRTDK